MPRTPPFETVRALQQALAVEGVLSVVGGSGLLVSLGLTDEAHDWDLVLPPGTVEAVERVLAAKGLGAQRAPGGHPRFATEALFTVDAGDHSIDVLVGFAIRTDDGVVTVPARAGASWRGLVMARADDWAVAYRAMGRDARAQLLEGAT
ncbi:hypothetical protein [Microcella sp.]|uniref:hypothetical protein n=1 Tax=Microcella sp. TaxID=1913979 RepID=UPI00256410D0|nr:hypothetical protein [Microcella sp.]MBX9470756.1 hypothetical protein [Microcella sp.]